MKIFLALKKYERKSAYGKTSTQRKNFKLTDGFKFVFGMNSFSRLICGSTLSNRYLIL